MRGASSEVGIAYPFGATKFLSGVCIAQFLVFCVVFCSLLLAYPTFLLAIVLSVL
jgi:hypothetical protein